MSIAYPADVAMKERIEAAYKRVTLAAVLEAGHADHLLVSRTGVTGGIWTRGILSHNQTLYQTELQPQPLRRGQLILDPDRSDNPHQCSPRAGRWGGVRSLFLLPAWIAIQCRTLYEEKSGRWTEPCKVVNIQRQERGGGERRNPSTLRSPGATASRDAARSA
jgi:hypothetical protein